jgi:FkbM family methyltransferase
MNYGDSDSAIGRAILDRGYSFTTIYDIGGSNGSWLNIMSKVFTTSRFELFEPLSEIHPSYSPLKDYMHAMHANSRMSAFAIGDHDGEITMRVYDDPSGSTTLQMGMLDPGKKVKVPLRTIDSLVKSGKYASPDLIKIDIQGGELAALKGAKKTLPNVTFLMLETWIERSYGSNTPLLHEIMEFLGPLGFIPYEFGDIFRGNKGQAIAVDVWFINKKKALDKSVY